MSGTNGHVKPSEPQLSPEEMKAKTKELRIANRYRQEKLAAKQTEILEQFYDYFSWVNYGGSSDLYEPYWYQQNQAGPGIPPAQPSDRYGGQQYPIWRTDVQLNSFRQASRIAVAGGNAYAKGLRDNLVNAIIGKGYTYKTGIRDTAKKDEERQEFYEKLRDAVQTWINGFIARNNWTSSSLPEQIDFTEETDSGTLAPGSTKEREMCSRTLRDGDGLLRLFYNDDGTVDVRFVDPTLVWGNPPGTTINDGWSYGIQHKVEITQGRDGQEDRHHDRERVVAYYIRPKEPDETSNNDIGGEVVPAKDIIQIKMVGEDTEVKHGVPLFFGDMLAALGRAAKGQRITSLTAAVQASTAEYWKHQIGTRDQIASLQNPGVRQVPGPNGSQIETFQPIPGQVRRGPASQEPVQMPTPQGPTVLPVWKGDLQQVGAAVSAPEAMISGDADTATYASMSEAGSTYVNAREADQEHFKEPYRRLMWRVVSWAVHRQRLPQEVLEAIDISVESPLVHKDNKQEMAQVMTAELAAKVTSPQMEMMKRGNDPKRVMADWKEYNEQMQEQNPMGALGGEQQVEEPADAREQPPQLKRSADVGESLRDLMEGFTGTITDKAGHKRHYVNGKQVKGEQELASHRKANPHDYGRHVEAQGTHEEELAERNKIHTLGKNHEVLVLPGRGKTGGNKELMKNFDPAYAHEVVQIGIEPALKIADAFQIEMGDALDALGTDDDTGEEADKAREQDAKMFKIIDTVSKHARESIVAQFGNGFTPELQAKFAEEIDSLKKTIDAESGKLSGLIEDARENMPEVGSDEFDEWKSDLENQLAEAQHDMDSEIKSAFLGFSDNIQNEIVYPMQRAAEEKEEAETSAAEDAVNDVRDSDDPEDLAAEYNRELEKDGNPNRVYFDEDEDEWLYANEEDLDDYPGKPKGKEVKESREETSLDDVAGMYADILYGLYGEDAAKNLRESKDASGHEHADDGKFTSGSGDSGDESEDDEDYEETDEERVVREQEEKEQAEHEAEIDAEEAKEKAEWEEAKKETLKEIDHKDAARVTAYLKKVKHPVGHNQLVAVFEMAGMKDPETLIDQMFQCDMLTITMHGGRTWYEPSSKEIKESLEAEILEAGFTGVVTDKRGRKIHYANGKRIKSPQSDSGPKKAAKASGTSKRAKKGSPEAIEAAKQAVSSVLKGESKVSPDAMIGHLDNLTVAQLTQLHKQHGVKAPGKLRAQLVESIKAKIGKSTEQMSGEKERSDLDELPVKAKDESSTENPAGEAKMKQSPKDAVSAIKELGDKWGARAQKHTDENTIPADYKEQIANDVESVIGDNDAKKIAADLGMRGISSSSAAKQAIINRMIDRVESGVLMGNIDVSGERQAKKIKNVVNALADVHKNTVDSIPESFKPAMDSLNDLSLIELQEVARKFLPREGDAASEHHATQEVKRSSRKRIMELIQNKILATYKAKQANKV